MISVAIAFAMAATLAPQPPETAAGRALTQCVAHSAGMGVINAAATESLAANGLIYMATPPPALASAALTAYGNGSFAASPSSEGEVWAVGYDTGVCIVFAIGVTPAPVEARFQELFGIPGAWKPEPIPPKEGARWSQQGWQVRPGLKLVAQTSVRPMPGQAKSFIMTTIAPNPKEDK